MEILLLKIGLNSLGENKQYRYSMKDCITFHDKQEALSFIKKNKENYCIYEVLHMDAPNILYFDIRVNDGHEEESNESSLIKYLEKVCKFISECTEGFDICDVEYVINKSIENNAHWHAYIPHFKMQTTEFRKIALAINRYVDVDEIYSIDSNAYVPDRYNSDGLRLISPSGCHTCRLYDEEEFDGDTELAGFSIYSDIIETNRAFFVIRDLEDEVSKLNMQVHALSEELRSQRLHAICTEPKLLKTIEELQEDNRTKDKQISVLKQSILDLVEFTKNIKRTTSIS